MILAHFQQSMAEALREKGASDGLAVTGAGHATEECLQIYRHHFLISLTEAIAATFPATRKQLGDTDFMILARCYVQAYPPRSGCLADYGQGFPDWLHNEVRVAPGEGDLAALEWILERVGMAPLPRSFPFQALGELPPARHEQVRFQLAAGVRLFSATWDVVSAYDRIRDGECPVPLPANGAATAGRFNWLIYRKAEGVGVFTADAFSVDIVRLCQAGKPLSALGDDLETGHLEALFSLVGKGLIDAFEE